MAKAICQISAENIYSIFDNRNKMSGIKSRRVPRSVHFWVSFLVLRHKDIHLPDIIKSVFVNEGETSDPMFLE